MEAGTDLHQYDFTLLTAATSLAMPAQRTKEITVS